jgi:pilus assembly protein Flp/PilA
MVYNRAAPPYHLDRRSRVIPFLSREEGQGLIEYALIIVLVAIIVIAILLLMSDVIQDWLNQFMNFIS